MLRYKFGEIVICDIIYHALTVEVEGLIVIHGFADIYFVFTKQVEAFADAAFSSCDEWDKIDERFLDMATTGAGDGDNYGRDSLGHAEIAVVTVLESLFIREDSASTSGRWGDGDDVGGECVGCGLGEIVFFEGCFELIDDFIAVLTLFGCESLTNVVGNFVINVYDITDCFVAN